MTTIFTHRKTGVNLISCRTAKIHDLMAELAELQNAAKPI